jgi:MFS family permease
VWVALSLIAPILIFAFTKHYNANLPRGDHAWVTLPVAIAAHDGTLTVGDLFVPNQGHITFYPHLVSAIFAWLTDWDIRLESYVAMVITFVTLVAAVWVARAVSPSHWKLTLPVFSVLLFALQFDYAWVVPRYTQWFFASMFLVVGVAVLLVLFPTRPRLAFGLAAFSAVSGMVSNATGVALFPALFITLTVVAWRKWGYLAAWVALTAAMAVVFFLLSGVEVASTGEEFNPSGIYIQPLMQLQFTQAMLGSGVMTGSEYFVEALYTGRFLLVLLVVNLVVLLSERSQAVYRTLAGWLPLVVYALISGILISLNRAVIAAMFLHYKIVGVTFWLGFVGVAVAVAESTRERRPRGSRPVTLVNVLVLALSGASFVFANYNALDQVFFNYKRLSETCHWAYMFTIDDTIESLRPRPEYGEDCVWSAWHMNDLSVRRMVMFADAEQVPIEDIIPTYQDGQPVIIETESGWESYHVQDWLLSGVPPEDVLHITIDIPVSYYTEPELPSTYITDPDAATRQSAVTDFIGDAETFWHVHRPEYLVPGMADYWTATDENHLRYDTSYETLGYIEFQITRYDRFQDVSQPLQQFGDNIELAAWSGLPEQINACDTVPLRSYWRSLRVPEMGYGYTATFVLMDDALETYARADSQLTSAPSNLWEPQQFYVDEREIVVPCDLPAGTYTIGIGVYDYQAPERLKVTAGETFMLDDLAVLARVAVGE